MLGTSDNCGEAFLAATVTGQGTGYHGSFPRAVGRHCGLNVKVHRTACASASWCGPRTLERRWDEAAGLSLDVVAYTAPQELTRGQRRREEGPAMDHIGIDVHKRESQICILAE